MHESRKREGEEINGKRLLSHEAHEYRMNVISSDEIMADAIECQSGVIVGGGGERRGISGPHTPFHTHTKWPQPMEA